MSNPYACAECQVEDYGNCLILCQCDECLESQMNDVMDDMGWE
jgi:hypothetical protein